jgi:hypothetical protein
MSANLKKFVFAYYGEPSFTRPEDGQKHMAEWGKWIKTLGTAMTDPGVPLKPAMSVSSKGVQQGGGPNRLTGYSVVQAKSIEEAIEMAKSSPHLHFGTIDVAEVMEMSMKG